MNNDFLAALACSASLVVYIQPAIAQAASQFPPEVSPETADTGSASPLEEIVVTATRREERLQDIPVSVTALTGSTLRSSGVAKIDTLTQVVPGLAGNREAATFRPVIRGVGSSGIMVGDEANVATYIDGIYQGGTPFSYVDLVEIERVEVLRGPQGTVFGRNATGGLINIITPDPSFDARGRVSAQYGRIGDDANAIDVRAYFTGPVTDSVAIDLAALYRKNGGYVQNLVGDNDYGDEKAITARSKLLFVPSDSAKIVLMGEYIDLQSEALTVQPFNNNSAARGIPGAVLPTKAWQSSVTGDPRIPGRDGPFAEYKRHNLALRTQFDLGLINLETSSGYSFVRTTQSLDSDATNIFLGNTWFNAEAKTYSQELRLLSNSSDRFKWLVGAYAFHLNGQMPLAQTGSSGPNTPVREVGLFPKVKTTSYAGFAEGTYDIAKALFVTLGARYTWEERKFSQAVNGVTLPFAPAEKTFSNWDYRASLRYELSEDANLYASYSTGFKSGVFNAAGTSPDPVNPETVKALEAGIKMDPLPWLRTNLSVYHYKYKDLQLAALDESGLVYILQNAASSTIYGGELEITAAATDDLTLRASAAYVHGRYDSFVGAQTFVPQPQGGNLVLPNDVSGNRLIRAPEWTFNLGFDWGHDVGGGRVGLYGNLYYSSKIYYDFLNLFPQKSYALITAGVSWTTPDEKWRFSLTGQNLTNAKVANLLRSGAFGTDIIYDQPRRVLVGAEVRF